MPSLILACLLACALWGSGLILHAQPSGLSGELALKARIAQLEAQLAQLQTEGAVCRAQFALAVQPKEQQAQAQQRQAIEKDAGCQVDWAVNPPACRADRPSQPDR
jgi:hypothetical protein